MSQGIQRLDPVVISGTDLSQLWGVSLESVTVYAYRDDVLAPIPAQVDERDEDGT